VTFKNELQRLIAGHAAFTPPSRIVDGIAEELWNARPAGVSHSIVEELWHVVYWLDRFLSWSRGEFLPYPASSAEGWRTFASVTPNEWDALRSRFLEGLDDACRLAESPVAELSVKTASCVEPGADRLSVYDVLINIAAHNAYHLGRIVQLRQMLGNWPPHGGGDSW
jgi:uncharacterized damage-inducible protein DinB